MEDYYSVDEAFDSDLLTNFRKEETPIYESAIADWEKKCPENKGLIYIKNKAYCGRGFLIDYCSALHIDGDRRDLSDFWEIFRLLEAREISVKMARARYDNEISKSRSQ